MDVKQTVTAFLRLTTVFLRNVYPGASTLETVLNNRGGSAVSHGSHATTPGLRCRTPSRTADLARQHHPLPFAARAVAGDPPSRVGGPITSATQGAIALPPRRLRRKHGGRSRRSPRAVRHRPRRPRLHDAHVDRDAAAGNDRAGQATQHRHGGALVMYSGIWLPIVTPFRSGEVDIDALERLAD